MHVMYKGLWLGFFVKISVIVSKYFLQIKIMLFKKLK